MLDPDEPGYDPGPCYTRCKVCCHEVPFEDLDDEGRCAAEDCEPPEEGEPHFADPGGNSALRAATSRNPRNLPCPTCRVPNRLTPADRARGYQCDTCADRAERGLDMYW